MNAEKQLQNAVVDYLECRGAYVVSVKSGKLLAVYQGRQRMIHLAPRGTPDVHACWNGRPLYIELKKDQATVENWHRVVDKYMETGVCAKSNLNIIDQHQCHKKIMRAGGSVIVCGSMEELEKDLQTLGFIPTPHSYGRPDLETIPIPREEASRRKEKDRQEGGKNGGIPRGEAVEITVKKGGKKIKVKAFREGNRIVFEKPISLKAGETITYSWKV